MSGLEILDREGRPEGGPWYQYFWPWFIVTLLGVSIAGSLVTVGIAVNGADPDVRKSAVVEEQQGPGPAADPRAGALD